MTDNLKQKGVVLQALTSKNIVLLCNQAVTTGKCLVIAPGFFPVTDDLMYTMLKG